MQDQATPLYLAISHEQDGKALALIKAGADVNVPCLQVCRWSHSRVLRGMDTEDGMRRVLRGDGRCKVGVRVGSRSIFLL